jgi:uncharacterized DUF497 family protein
LLSKPQIYSFAFLWDKVKNRKNQNKHNVSFEEAQTVFYDEQARLIYDPDHPES